MNLFREHFQRETARQAAGADEYGAGPSNAAHLMLMKLSEDRRRLKTVQSTERKAAVKRELLPDYAPYVEGVLAADAGLQDEVVITVMVWRIDAGDYRGALDIAPYVLRHQLLLPDRFSRTPATAIADEIADAAKRARDGQQPFDASLLAETLQLTEREDMPDQARAKLQKELGLLLRDSEPEAALAYLRRAQQLAPTIGVKKDIERLERVIKNTASPEGEA